MIVPQRSSVLIAPFEPYPACKDSGVERLGHVPAHWAVRRLRNVSELRVSNVDKHTREGEAPVRLCNYVDVYKNARIRSGMAFMVGTATADEIRQFRLRSGDVLITKDSEVWNDIGVPALVQDIADDVVSGYHLALLRPYTGCLAGRFLFRALESCCVAQQLHVQANGVTRFGLSHNAIKSVRLPVPPLHEQAAIGSFLDYVDLRIRRYIRAKQKLIALLGEQKQAIIHQAVTGQLDVRTGRPLPAYKPSGVEWLGDVPEQWEIARLGRLIELLTGFPFKSDGFTHDADDIRLLRGVNIAPGKVRWNDIVRWPIRDRPSYLSFELHAGDIVLGMDRPIIQSGVRVATIEESDLPSLLLQRVACIRPDEGRLRADFLMLLLAGKSFSSYLTPIFTGISVPHLSPEQIRLFRFALPAVMEQAKIVNWTVARTKTVESAVKRTRREIALLGEYRTRLIADVVTGKLDVREAAAQFPDEVGELEPIDEADALDGEEEPTDALATVL